MITDKRDNVKGWLRSRDIIVPDDWLAACLEWIEGEVQGTTQSVNQLNDAVYEQWLLSDLHELQCPCLPTNVVSDKKYQLTGRYAVQIDNVVDVSKPYYGQMLKVKGAENDNMSVTAEPPAPWEPKPTRMLMLKITDGVSDVEGMEYRQIAGINEKLPPGTKAVIQGPVLCRNGVLMLKAENIKILGGEADSLLEEGMPQNVLKKALERSMQFGGKEHRQEFGGGPVWNRKQGQKGVKHEMPKTMYGSQRQGNTGAYQGNRSNLPPVKMEPMNIQNVPVRNQDDEFDDDITLEDFLGDMGEFDSAPPQPKGKGSSSSGSHTNSAAPSTLLQRTSTNKVLQLVSGKPQASGNVQRQMDARSFSDSSANPGQSRLNFPTQAARNDLNSRVSKEPSKSRTSSCVLSSSSGFNSSQSVKPSALSHQSKFNTMPSGDDDLFGDDFEEELDDFDFTSIPTNAGVSNQRGSCTTSTAPSYNKNARNDNDISCDRPEKVCKIEPSLDNNTKSRSSTSSALSLQKKKTTTASKLSSALNAARSSGASNSLSNDNFSKLTSTERIDTQAISQTPDVGLMSRFTTIRMSPSAMLPVDAEPFTYLSLVKRQIPLHTPLKFKVKAYISTLLDKLDFCDGKMWKLSCKINDGSDSLDVSLSNAVLTQLIGFSSADSLVMRKRAQSDPSVREILAEGVQQCQQKLIELLHVMEIQVHPDQDKPEVVSIRMLSDSDVNALETRVSEAVEKLSR